MSLKKNALATVALTGIAVAVSSAYAAGFQLAEQSAVGQGRAMAGAGIVGDDLSALHFNAAGMTLLPGTRIQVGGTWIEVNAEYKGVSGATENGRYKGQMIPHGYISHQLNDQTWLGLAMTVPYGMGTEYAQNWEGADKGTEATILTFDFNPQVAYKVNDFISVGGGISIQYARAQLCEGIGPVGVKVKGDSIDWGWNFGVMIQPTETLRFGLGYRSNVAHDAEGDTTFSGLNAFNPYSGMSGLPTFEFASQMKADMDLRLRTPDTIHLSATWEATQDLRLSGLIRWTKWSNFGVLNIKNQFNSMDQMVVSGITGMTGSAININHLEVENDWEDSWYFSIGADYRLNNQWTVRGGIGYDKDPIHDQTKRMAVIPDTDRLWLSLGTSYKYNDNFTFDVGATYIKGIGDTDLYHKGEAKPFGDYKSLDSVIVAASMQYRF